MKHTLYTLVIGAVAILSFGSCSDYLGRSPLDSNSDATNWTSEESIETFTWKFYGYLREKSYGNGNTRGQYHIEQLTDDYSPETFPSFTKQVPASSSAWNTPYDRIRETNILINRIGLVPNLPEKAAKHWEGVAKFFRSLYYFDLVSTYGDVVWVDDEVDYSKEEERMKSRTSRIDVMTNVVNDLQFAVDNCYSPSEAAENTVNSDVAAALLSRVALYEAAWEKYHKLAGGKSDFFYKAAKDAAAKVIDSGRYEVTENYKGMYTSVSLVGSKEVILYKVYTLANVNNGKVSMAHGTFGYSVSSTPTWGLTKSAVENYAASDGIPIHMKKYDDQTIAGIFSNRDKRLAQTVHPEWLPVTDAVLVGVGASVSTTGFWTYKFVPFDRMAKEESQGTWMSPYNETDGPIFQYSEVLENYAEACAELGSITQADLDKSVNLLRVRHGGIPALTLAGTGVSVNGTAITAEPGNPGISVLLQELRRDRRSELMADGLRHNDLMRWALGKNLDTKLNPSGYVGASKNAILEYINTVDDKGWTTKDKWLVNNFFVDGYKSPWNTSAVGASGAVVDHVWDDKYYLEPIPSGQISLDSNLSQNPGW